MTACQMVFLSFSLPARLIHPLVSHPISSQLHWAACAHFVELLLASVAVLATWHISSKKASGKATLLTRCKWMSIQGTMEGDGKVLSWQ